MWLRIKIRFLRRTVEICLVVKHIGLGGGSLWVPESDSTVSYFPMKHDEWKLMNICQPSFARTKEEGCLRFDFLDFPDVLFHMYLCCFKKSKQANKQTEKKFTFKTDLACKLIYILRCYFSVPQELPNRPCISFYLRVCSELVVNKMIGFKLSVWKLQLSCYV